MHILHFYFMGQNSCIIEKMLAVSGNKANWNTQQLGVNNLICFSDQRFTVTLYTNGATSNQLLSRTKNAAFIRCLVRKIYANLYPFVQSNLINLSLYQNLKYLN